LQAKQNIHILKLPQCPYHQLYTISILDIEASS